MHILICAMIGGLLSWGVCRKKTAAVAGSWALRAGALGAMLPFLDVLFSLISAVTGLAMPDRFGLLWSPLLAPFIAGLLVMFLSLFVDKSWGELISAVMAGLFGSIVLTMLTPVGVELVPFVPETRISLSIVNRFDYVLFVLSLVVLCVGVMMPSFRRDIARVGIVVIIGYLFFLVYCHWEAKAIGQNYAKALEVNVDKMYALPQPLSPFNWRIIVLDKDHFLHDTLIHLYRKETLEVKEDSPRTRRIEALYRPVQEAVWRVYNRFGTASMTRAQKIYVFKAWHAIEKSPYAAKMRFAVFSDFTLPPLHRLTNAETCAVFKDLRFEGARKNDKSAFLACGNADLSHFSLLQRFKKFDDHRVQQYKVLQK